MDDLGQVEKKLRETEFFLSKMAEQEGRAFGDKEPFDFYLSAFLNAARTVDYRLRHEQGTVYEQWRAAWDLTLSAGQLALIKFLVDDRNVEVHESGSGRSVVQEEIEVRGEYSDPSGTLQAFGPPMPLLPGASLPTVRKPIYNFTIATVERRAVDACNEYLQLLTRMVSEFKAAHP